MGTVRSLLALGNAKLGRAIHHFDLPAVETCPGRSDLCESVCYALRGRFHADLVQKRLRWCLRQSRQPDFADRMVGEVRGKGALVVRVHVSGDFYSAGYAEKWLNVFRRCPATTFYFYTRSWRVEAVAPVLDRMADRENVRVWYSADAETGRPDLLPEGVGVAWLQTQVDEPVAGDLVFRDEPIRLPAPLPVPLPPVPLPPMPRPNPLPPVPAPVSLPLVCPNETPAGRKFGANCGNCGFCWKA